MELYILYLIGSLRTIELYTTKVDTVLYICLPPTVVVKTSFTISFFLPKEYISKVLF
nr:MAG TPA: hypothetical protein [Caudoviricetes sp.]